MGSSKTHEGGGGCPEVGDEIAMVDQFGIEVVGGVVGKWDQGRGERGLGGGAVVEFEG